MFNSVVKLMKSKLMDCGSSSVHLLKKEMFMVSYLTGH